MRHLRNLTLIAVAAITLVLSGQPAGAQTDPDLIALHPEVDVPLEDIAPGDWSFWVVTVENVYDQPVLVGIADPFTSENDGLVADSADALHAQIGMCDEELVPSNDDTIGYTCPGTYTELASMQPFETITFNVNQKILAPGEKIHMLTKISFPATAGNDWENLSSNLHLQFVASFELPDIPDPDDTGGIIPGPGEPSTDSTTGTRGPLVRTGAAIGGLVALGIVLIVGGAVIVFGARDRNTEDDLTQTV